MSLALVYTPHVETPLRFTGSTRDPPARQTGPRPAYIIIRRYWIVEGLARLLSIRVKRNSSTFRPVLCKSTLPNRPKSRTHISTIKPLISKEFLCGEGNGPLIRLGIFAKNNPTPENGNKSPASKRRSPKEIP